jgi:hypothetical protein
MTLEGSLSIGSLAIDHCFDLFTLVVCDVHKHIVQILDDWAAFFRNSSSFKLTEPINIAITIVFDIIVKISLKGSY